MIYKHSYYDFFLQIISFVKSVWTWGFWLKIEFLPILLPNEMYNINLEEVDMNVYLLDIQKARY